ncbi:MAG: TPM domain-containing protein [Candidatus Eremiobacteraeota bacterium]|nr:TPM domain-containing protein [Candidatus Eremiobacteraeota bacterium]MCW5869280.1 TPM domain-containing protein [Candidatus Eremiobacteraeota bacterium]
MVDARRLYSPEEREQIRQALQKAESATAGEIVCAVASESGRYDRAEALIGFACSLLLLGLLHSLHHGGSGSWGGAEPLSLGWEIGVLCAGFLLGNLLGAWLPGLRTALVPRREMEEESMRAAWAVFCNQKLSSTAKRGGLLIYFSLFERRVVILADQGALEALTQSGLEQVRNAAITALRQGKPLQAMLDCISQAGQLLAEKLPCHQGGGANELSDDLVILHPRP